MSKEENSVLTEEFLLELYYQAAINDFICGIVSKNMKNEYLPDKDFQMLNEILCRFYDKHRTAPTLPIFIQATSEDKGAYALACNISEVGYAIEPNILVEQLEQYIINVKFMETYRELGSRFNSKDHKGAQKLLTRFSDWYTNFSLQQSDFVDVAETFASRFMQNREKHNEDNKMRPIDRFYIDDIDVLNKGRDLRTQLTCFLAPTGVGKSHAARYIGKMCAQIGGLNVLHIQLEGSEKESLDAYSAAMANCSVYNYGNGTISNIEFEKIKEVVKASSGTIKVKSYPKFIMQVSTSDVKNSIAEYSKVYGKNPDVVVIDSMDLLTDASGKNWTENGERHKRIRVAENLKDIAADENIWIVVTYQATIENRDWLNDEKNVLTEYNCSEAKGLARPMTHLITLNQSDAERNEETMRLYIAKSRFFKKGGVIKIATNYENEQFYDAKRTVNNNLSVKQK